MEKFVTLTSTIVPLPVDNVDTDQIIPARYLKSTTREGFGENLFRDWRYDEDNTPVSSFVLNDPTYKGDILLTGKNFGSGSSREHAAWAIYDYGFKVVLSENFADIFKNNALNNGLLAVELPPEWMNRLFRMVEEDPETKLTVNLEDQYVKIVQEDKKISFEINAYRKMCLLKGYSDIDFLLSKSETIKDYEQTNPYVIKD